MKNKKLNNVERNCKKVFDKPISIADLNRKIATDVMEYKCKDFDNLLDTNGGIVCSDGCDVLTFNPIGNMTDAWKVIEKLVTIKLGGDFPVIPALKYNYVSKEWRCLVEGTIICEWNKSASMAICLAALKVAKDG